MASLPATMKALIKREETESYEFTETEVPEPSADEVLIKVEAVSICGSDIALYQWNEVAKVIATVPFIPGHECAGVVVKGGPDSTFKVGDRVAVENHFFCGECYQCQHDRGDICQNMGQYGHGKKTMHGGFSQYSIVSSKYCFPITKGLSAEEAVLLEPLGVAHNAMEQLEVAGEEVLILGAGPIGMLACSVAKTMGATRVLIADIVDSRLELAKTMGADVTINSTKSNLKQVIMEETHGNGIARICEMSGAAAMVNNQFSLLRKAGVVVMVGLPKTPIHIENPLPDIVFKALTLRTVHGRRIWHTWQAIESLVAEKKVDLLKVVSHRIPMSKFEEAFQTLFSGQAVKIVIDPHS